MLTALLDVAAGLIALTAVAALIVAAGTILDRAAGIRDSPAAADLAAWRTRRAAARAHRNLTGGRR